MTAPQSQHPPTSTPLPQPRGKRLLRRPWFIALLVIVVVAALAGVGYRLSTTWRPLADVCGQMIPVRHGLPCDVPLTSDAQFLTTQSDSPEPEQQYTGWLFTSSESVGSMTHDLEAGFRADGWSCVGSTSLAGVISVVATHKSDRPDTTAFVDFQADVAPGTNDYVVILAQNFLLPPDFQCGGSASRGG